MSDRRRAAVGLADDHRPDPEGAGARPVLTEQCAYFGDTVAVAGREEGTRWPLDALGEELARPEPARAAG
jgi:hypothetical protein